MSPRVVIAAAVPLVPLAIHWAPVGIIGLAGLILIALPARSPRCACYPPGHPEDFTGYRPHAHTCPMSGAAR